MKVAIVTDTYEPQVNGVVNVVKNQRSALEKIGVETKLFAPMQNVSSFPYPLNRE